MSKNKAIRKEKREQLNASRSAYPRDSFVEPTLEDLARVQVTDPKRFKTLASRDFLVQLFTEANGVVRMTVTKNQLGFGNRTFADGISWEELQHIKDSIGYHDKMAIEIYPESNLIVNDCNMRHLWILPKPLAIGWR